MIPAITSLYAGLLALLYLVISGWVIRVRMQQKVMSGDKGAHAGPARAGDAT